MAKYSIVVSDHAWYPEIEAESKEQAKQIAWEWFIQREPDFEVEEFEEDEEVCAEYRCL